MKNLRLKKSRAVRVAAAAAAVAADRLVVNATDGEDAINVQGDADVVKSTGLAAGIVILHPEAANDRLEINTLAGRDAVDSSGLAAGAIQLLVERHPRPLEHH